MLPHISPFVQLYEHQSDRSQYFWGKSPEETFGGSFLPKRNTHLSAKSYRSGLLFPVAFASCLEFPWWKSQTIEMKAYRKVLGETMLSPDWIMTCILGQPDRQWYGSTIWGTEASQMEWKTPTWQPEQVSTLSPLMDSNRSLLNSLRTPFSPILIHALHLWHEMLIPQMKDTFWPRDMWLVAGYSPSSGAEALWDTQRARPMGAAHLGSTGRPSIPSSPVILNEGLGVLCTAWRQITSQLIHHDTLLPSQLELLLASTHSCLFIITGQHFVVVYLCNVFV